MMRKTWAVLWCLAVAAVPASTLATAVRAFSPIPFGDQWDEVRWWQALQAGASGWDHLWQPHNSHCLAVPRLFFLADLAVFHGTNVFLIGTGIALQAATAGLLVWELRRWGRDRPSLALALAGVTVMLLFAAVQIENFAWGFQLPWFLVFGGAVGAIVSLNRAAAHTGRRARVWRSLAIALAWVATFSMASGVLIWPLLLGAACVWNDLRPARLPLALWSLPAVGLWLWVTLPTVGGAGGTFPGALVFTALYLGAPWRYYGEGVAATVGGVGGIAAVVLGGLLVRPGRSVHAFQRVHLLLLGFTAASAVAAGVGRGLLPPSAVLTGRYAGGALFFWVALLTLAVAEGAIGGARRPLAWVSAGGAIGLALTIAWPGQWLAAREARALTNLKDRAGLALVVGVRDRALAALYPKPEELLRLRPFLQRQRLSPFHRWWAHTLDRPLTGVARLESRPAAGSGRISGTSAVLGWSVSRQREAGVRAFGARTNPAGDEVVVLTDERGDVRGFGLPGLDADDPLAWNGFARATGHGLLRAWAANDRRRAVALDGAAYVGELTALRSPLTPGDWHAEGSWELATVTDPTLRFDHGYVWAATPAGGTLRSQPFHAPEGAYLVIPLVAPPPLAGTLTIEVRAPGMADGIAPYRAALQAFGWTQLTILLPPSDTRQCEIVVRAEETAQDGLRLIGEPRIGLATTPASRAAERIQPDAPDVAPNLGRPAPSGYSGPGGGPMADGVAIITGAGKGIGRATALALARAGYALALNSRTAVDLERVRDEVATTGGRAVFVVGDAADPSVVRELVRVAEDDLGGLSAVVTCAGVAPLASIAALGVEDFDRMVAVNVRAPFLLTKAAWSVLARAGDAAIVHVSSLGSLDPFPGFAAYGASKAFINTFVRGLAHEGRDANIRVYAVAPGAVETSMLRALFPDFPHEQTLAPDEVARVIVEAIRDPLAHESGDTIFLSRQIH